MARDLAHHLGAEKPLLIALVAIGTGIIAVVLFRRRARLPAVVLMLALLPFGAGHGHAHEGHDHGPEAASAQPSQDLAQRLPDGSLFVPKPTQRILGVRTLVVAQTNQRKALELPGRIIPNPNASGLVQASVSGRLSPPEGGFPKLGTPVKVGDVLALVTPPLQAIDVSDMRQRAGELDQQMSIVERRIARYEPLVQKGATAQTLLDEAILELRGLRERRASLERVRRETEQLVAPVSGIVATANAVAGQIAETNAVVFQIIDPARLYVEALAFNLIPDGQAATARTSEGRSVTLKFQGAGYTDRSQAIPVHFAIQGDTKNLRVGQLVTVLAETGDTLEGLAVPRTSILRAANGQTTVFEHITAERFEARAVRFEPLDGDRVLVLAGLAPGKRIVVQGAELLNQIR